MPINVSQKSIYESYSMFHPDGTLMCHTDAKRAKWYVERDLAEWLDEKSFKLKFAPHGYGKADSAFYTQKIDNKCVVCGEADNGLNKHHIVPYVFRSRMPVEYKSSNHHDVVPTCVDCHEEYEGHATHFKAQLCEEYGTTMNMGSSVESRHNHKVKSARNMVHKMDNNLLVDDNGNAVVLPAERIEFLRNMAAQPLYEDDNKGAVWADHIMKQVLENNELFDFIKKWRQHFLDHAKPQHMPEHWSVNHPLEVIGAKKRASVQS